MSLHLQAIIHHPDLTLWRHSDYKLLVGIYREKYCGFPTYAMYSVGYFSFQPMFPRWSWQSLHIYWLGNSSNNYWLFYSISTSLRWRLNGHDGVSNHQPHHCLLNRLFERRSKKTSKLRVTGLCVGNSPGTGEFPAQMASNAENVSIWWRHHDGIANPVGC